MRQRTVWRVGALLVGLTVALAGCGGGSTSAGLGSTSGSSGGSSTGSTGSTGGTGSGGTSGTATVTGVAMPSSVSVVTATHAN
jgi:hypothetical protein